MKRFPLAPLVELRAHAVESCRETLAERDLQLSKARLQQAQSEQLERDHDATRRRVEQQEEERLAAGEMTARDLNQRSDYDQSARAVALRLRRQNEVQVLKVERSMQERSEAEQALAHARVEHRVLEQKRDKFVQGERARLEAHAEEGALEAWQVRKVPC